MIAAKKYCPQKTKTTWGWGRSKLLSTVTQTMLHNIFFVYLECYPFKRNIQNLGVTFVSKNRYENLLVPERWIFRKSKLGVRHCLPKFCQDQV